MPEPVVPGGVVSVLDFSGQYFPAEQSVITPPVQTLPGGHSRDVISPLRAQKPFRAAIYELYPLKLV